MLKFSRHHALQRTTEEFHISSCQHAAPINIQICQPTYGEENRNIVFAGLYKERIKGFSGTMGGDQCAKYPGNMICRIAENASKTGVSNIGEALGEFRELNANVGNGNEEKEIIYQPADEEAFNDMGSGEPVFITDEPARYKRKSCQLIPFKCYHHKTGFLANAKHERAADACN
ncbi:unnamed protein product [Gongylonema pulchrum]|uniref:Uncharacterized protein n=1 Tax=Gongylonema pulchrum TaxID=637853 RepID=A0A183EUC8_9BILA|nr:unnamed protein product [Gongylonema pulchrum]